MSTATSRAQGEGPAALGTDENAAHPGPDENCHDIRGIVKWFDVKKGFGFIVGPQGQDVFVHFSSIDGDGFRTLKDGESVVYELCEGDKGYHARAVRRDESTDRPKPKRAPVHHEIPPDDAPPRRRPAIDGYVG